MNDQLTNPQPTEITEETKLYVGNLPWSVTSEELKEMFSQFGEVTDAVVITDKITRKSKGFGFVTFARAEDAKVAQEKMSHFDMNGRALVVNAARPRTERPQTGGYGR